MTHPFPIPDDGDADRYAHDDLVDAADRRRAVVTRMVASLRLRHEAQEAFAAERRAAEPVPPFDAGFLGDILARPQDPPHRVEDLIPSDSGTLIVAQRKTGKTTLELNIARAFITGEDLLGKFGTRPVDGNVALINYEVSGQTLARWADDQSIPHNRLFLVNVRGRRNPLGNAVDRATLADKLRALDIETLIVDPFGRAYTGTNQNDSGEVGAWLADLDRFTRGEVGAKDLILAAHAGWNGERTRGATALEDWADSIITLTRDTERQDLRFLRAEGRDINVPEDQLQFDEPTRTLTLAGSGSRKSAVKVRRAEALIPTVIELLRATPSMSGNQLDKQIASLIASGDLDAQHSKGDGARAAHLLERRRMVISKKGPRNADLFTLITTTSPSSPAVPPGTSSDLPHLPYGEGGRQEEVNNPTTTEGTRLQETS